MTKEPVANSTACAAGGRRTGLQWAVAVAMAAVLAGCSSPPPKPAAPPRLPPTTLDGRIVGAANLNPSINNRPSPLVLRVYELRGPTTFNQAEFMALYQADQATLAADVLSRDELTLQPGESRPYSKPLAPDTRFIGVVALYRDLEHARWRTVVPVQPNRTNVITIRADALAVTALVQP